MLPKVKNIAYRSKINIPNTTSVREKFSDFLNWYGFQ